MDYLTNLPAAVFLLSLFTSSYAATFEVRNNCPFVVWAAATPVGGGQRLDRSESWTVNVPPGTQMGRIWGRTNCKFDANGRGACRTGDCGGVLHCTKWSNPPVTLTEFTLNISNNDFFDISLVDGFNLPIQFAPTNSSAAAGNCRAISCTEDINGQCPRELRVGGGCNNPCAVFRTPEFCCTANNGSTCARTGYSIFFKSSCPDAYSYPKDDSTSTFYCPGGTTNYRVVFCP